MAERIDWQTLRNQILNNQAPSWWQRVEIHQIPDYLRNAYNHPFSTAVRERVGVAAAGWWENVDPRKFREKDWAWRIGFAVGVAESVAVVLLPPGSGLIKGAANATLMHGTYLGSNIATSIQRRYIEQRYAGSVDLADRLNKLETDKTTTDARIKSAFKGVAAGAMYSSLPFGILRELGVQSALGLDNRGQAPVIDIGRTTGFVGAKVNETAEGVGSAVRHVLGTAKDITPTSTPTAEAVREALQTPTGTPTPGLRAPTSVPERTPQAVGTPEPPREAVSTPEIPSVGEQAAVPHGTLAETVSKFLAENQNNPDLVVEHVVAQGETAGHMVLQMGGDVTWDGSDWESFAILRALNPSAFSDLQHAMNLTPDQFDELIKKIQAGDKESYRLLINKMGLVRAGNHLKLLTPKGLQQLRGILGR